jgi:hypothetical protein
MISMKSLTKNPDSRVFSFAWFFRDFICSLHIKRIIIFVDAGVNGLGDSGSYDGGDAGHDFV